MIVNIKFNNINVKNNLNELFLFYKLRMHAISNGGYINRFKMTKNEKYKIFKNLIKLGWIKKDKVVKYRSIIPNDSILFTNILKKDLKNKDSFKAFLLSTCEAYFLTTKNFKNKLKESQSDWGNAVGTDSVYYIKKIKVGNNLKIKGRVFNKEVIKFTGLSTPTVSRWRKISKKLGYNKYNLVRNKIGKSSILKDHIIKRFQNGGSYYSIKGKCPIVCDLYVETGIEIFKVRKISR